MKKTLLFVGFSLFCLSLLAAPNGFLGIWFGQKIGNVNKSLIEQGYIPSSDSVNSLIYVSKIPADISKIELNTDSCDCLTSWKLYFSPQLPAEKFYGILQQAIEIHGKDYRSSLSDNAIIWRLENGRDFRLSFDGNLALQFGLYQ